MRTTTATLAVAALVLAASSASATCAAKACKKGDPIVCAAWCTGKMVADQTCKTEGLVRFTAENLLLAPYAFVKSDLEAYDIFTKTIWNGDEAAKMFVCGVAEKPCYTYAERNFGKKLFVPEQKAAGSVASPTLTDYLFGAPAGMVVGPFKYSVAAAEKGMNDAYCAGKGGFLGAVAAYPTAAVYAVVGFANGLVKGPLVGGPWGWAGMRQCGSPFTVYVK